ncbi:MAG: hypothetical protein AB7G08_31070 [Hyphomicrobiaceae bacterium]
MRLSKLGTDVLTVGIQTKVAKRIVVMRRLTTSVSADFTATLSIRASAVQAITDLIGRSKHA